MLDKEKDLTVLDKYVTLIIILGPMFTQYASLFDIILLPELFIIPVLLWYFIKTGFDKVLNLNTYFTYLLVAFILTLINILISPMVNISISISAYLRHIFYATIIISLVYKNFNIDFAAKSLIVIASVNSIYGIIQFIAYNMFGKILPWYFNFLNVKHGTKLIENQVYYFSQFGYRFSGMFSEPAHFSQYIAIALLTVLFYKSKYFELKKITIVLIASLFFLVLLLNGSGTGFAIVIFCILILFINNKNRKLSNLILRYFFITIVLILLYYISTSTIFSSGLNRIMSTTDSSSGNIRIFRPFFVYKELPFLNKIIGVGYANYSEYVLNSGIATNYELSLNSAWTNTIGYILVGSGIIGIIFYSFFYISLLKITKGFSKYMVFLLGIFAIFTEVPLSFQFITIMGFILKDLSPKSQKFI